MQNRFFFILFSLFVLSACQPALIRSDEAYISISNEATIEITQAIEVSPNSARAFLQEGEVIPYEQLNLYEVNCEIEVNTVSEDRQTIEAGVFNIISILQDESLIVDNENEKDELMVATLGFSRELAAFGNSDSPVDIKRYYKFKLSPLTPKQAGSKTEVRSVTCRGVQDTPFNAELPSFEEIRAASGKYVTFSF